MMGLHSTGIRLGWGQTLRAQGGKWEVMKCAGTDGHGHEHICTKLKSW